MYTSSTRELAAFTVAVVLAIRADIIQRFFCMSLMLAG